MHTNPLIHEKSPYLLQHAHNPVEWHPWGEEAFRKAREQDKPIFLSIGYSTCHWCHVMERESFEQEHIAQILNEHFISIKVDREERPDVDRIYMLFVQATTGSGGWPMSVWITPELKPFYGGTYFPPDNRYGRPGFPHVLHQLADAWREQRANLVNSSVNILGELEKHASVASGDEALKAESLDACYRYFQRTFDKRLGGFGNAPKFPRPSVLNFLFRYYHRTGEEDARDMALLTLREMAKGGMNDQLGGGFHRYSVDERWFVPHFEKMLYDQAQLAISYLEAFQITGDAQYATTARAVFEYVLRDMTHEGGAFYSAEDADSAPDAAKPNEKSEGAFFIWSQEEIGALLGPERGAAFARAFGCMPNGNVESDPHGEFTGKNILYRREDWQDSGEIAILLAAREQRPRPHLDDKILTSWNAMMISAFARGAQVLDEPRYLAAAQRAATFIDQTLVVGGRLQRRWRDGEAAIDAFLDDYSALTLAHLDLYETTFAPAHLERARALALAMLEQFEDKQNGGFYSSPVGNTELVLRLKEDYDGAEPSGNSLAAQALLRLAHHTGEEAFREAAADTLAAFATRINEQSVTVPQMLCALMESLAAKSEMLFSGEAAELIREFRRHYRPFTVVQSQPGDRPAAALCENFVCLQPAHSVEELRGLLN
ncbi:MAG: thioredoxin domain-containing protein [Bryobacterales bacterium]|nr:thioredoxin domain-containing protein [Bryobacterales bacterium]